MLSSRFFQKGITGLSFLLICSSALTQSCPQIEKGEINMVSDDGGGNCTYRVDFTMNVTGSNKSIRVIVSCGTTAVLNECFVVSSTQNGMPFSSSTFSCPCASAKTLIFSSFTNDNCGGSSCGSFGDVLPVTLTSVSLAKRNNLACIAWKVAGESSIDKYIIEYSPDAAVFSRAGSVTAINNNQEHEYTFCDPVSRKNGFYRIKIVSLPGEEKYSTVVRFTAETTDAVEIYPNPVSTTLHITLPLSGRLNNAGFEIYSSEGKLVLSGKLLHPSIDVSALQKGSYRLHLKNGNELLAAKSFIKN